LARTVCAIRSLRSGAIGWLVASAMQVALRDGTRVLWPAGEKGAVRIRSDVPLLPMLAMS
jgi:hypothetical protein